MRIEPWRYKLRLLLRALRHRADVEQELDDEIAFHIEQQTELNIARGMSPADARRAARHAFGIVEARKQDCRDHWVVAALDHVTRDARHAMRELRAEPGFALGVLLLLALGIGANVAVFSVVNGVLLRPLPYAAPERLMFVAEQIPERDQTSRSVNALHYREWLTCDCFDQIALAEYVQTVGLAGQGEPTRVTSIRVTPNAFALLGILPQLGRVFVAEDAGASRDEAIVISDGLWRRQFGADLGIVGKTVTLDAIPVVVVGVLPSGFQYYGSYRADIDIYRPWAVEPQPWWAWTNNYSYSAVGRLAAGISQAAARDALDAVQASIAAEHFGAEFAALSLRSVVEPLHERVTMRSRAALWLLLAAVATTLLVACLNIANLMLVRATARSRETGIRTALGATRLVIFRSVLIESAMLAFAGAAGGIAVAWVGLQVFKRAALSSLPRLEEVQLDAVALLVAGLIAVAATVAFGLVPALRLTRAAPERALQGGSRTATDSAARVHAKQALVCGEVGLSVALLILAGLLLTSFLRLDTVDRGFDAQSVFTAEVGLPSVRYSDDDARLRFWNRLLDRLATTPSVSSAAIASVLPLSGNYFGSTAVRAGENPPQQERPRIQYRFVSEGYFDTLGIPVLRGRPLVRTDYALNAAVVSSQTARLLWGDADPIGRRFHWGDPDDLFEVVGVVADVHSVGLETAPDPIVYRPITGAGNGRFVLPSGSIALRTAGDAALAAGVLRGAVNAIDPELAVSSVRSMQQIESAVLGERRVQLGLVGAFATASLLVAAIGIYSVLAYAVSLRSHELAMRMALGAQRGRVLALVLRQGLVPVALGLLLGVGAALGLGQLVAGLLFAVTPTDAPTYASVIAVTLGVALLACLLPAHRAARTPLLTVLR